jgi:hypothetical protein
MWIALIGVLLVAIAGTLIYFSLRKIHPSDETGFTKKYRTLRALLKQNHTLQSERGGSKSLMLKFREKNGAHSYLLTEVDGKLIVVWTLESEVHGKRGKEWSFDITLDQEEVFEEIQRDITNYQKSLFRES